MGIVGLCECGCGEKTRLSKGNNPAKGHVLGQPLRYIRGHMSRVTHANRLVRTHCRHGHELAEVGRLDCLTCRSLSMKRRRDTDKAKALDYERTMARKYSLRKFGMTPGDYDRMLIAQGGKCAICFQFPRFIRSTARLHVDHDHATGAVRGLLCTLCNLALGKMEDSPDRLRRAADYLEEHARSQKTG